MRAEGGHSAPQQLAFDFARSPERPSPRDIRHRLYFAVLPEPRTAARMTAIGADLQRRQGLTGQLKQAGLLHVSLAKAGEGCDLPEAVVAAAIRAGAMIEHSPFEVSFDRVASFNGGTNRAQVLRCGKGIGKLVGLGHMLERAMFRMELGRRVPKDFAPHVTLRYDRERVPETMLDAPVTWTVREFVLVHSLVGRGRHIHVARWPLR
jgi:2'-5' RNA ligase